MIGHLLNSRVTLYRSTFAADGSGGRTRTPAAVRTWRAKISQPTTEERVVAAQDGVNLSHIVHVPYGIDVRRGDELDTGGDRRLRVVAVVSNSRHSYTRLECEVVQGGP